MSKLDSNILATVQQAIESQCRQYIGRIDSAACAKAAATIMRQLESSGFIEIIEIESIEQTDPYCLNVTMRLKLGRIKFSSEEATGS